MDTFAGRPSESPPLPLYLVVRLFPSSNSVRTQHNGGMGAGLVETTIEPGPEEQTAGVASDRWPDVARDTAKVMNPARGAIIGLSIALAFWLSVFLLTGMILN